MEDWIPVTKRFPEVGLRVITCSYTRKIRIAQLMRSGAWMPLPEAYENGEE